MTRARVALSEYEVRYTTGIPSRSWSTPAVEARGATFVMLPPYSPDLTPVEEAGANIKEHVRGANPRTFEALIDAIGEANATVTSRDACGWFADRASYLSARTGSVGPPL